MTVLLLKRHATVERQSDGRRVALGPGALAEVGPDDLERVCARDRQPRWSGAFLRPIQGAAAREQPGRVALAPGAVSGQRRSVPPLRVRAGGSVTPLAPREGCRAVLLEGERCCRRAVVSA